MKIGIIHCLDSVNDMQNIWIKSFQIILENLGIIPHIINDPNEVKEGYHYIWRPSAGNFNGKFKNTETLSLELVKLANDFELKGAILYPNSNNVKFYENKKEIFKTAYELGIKIPDTYIFSTKGEALETLESVAYPLILKHAFSCNSFGIMKADNFIDLKEKILNENFDIKNYVFQKKLELKNDIRINFVENQNILSYCRYIKKGEISSASKFDSRIDHFSVPFPTYDYAYEIGKKFNFPFGGIDFAFEDGQDLYNDKPYFLEISPLFDLNPMPNMPIKNWKTFKNSWKWKKSYNHAILQAANLEINYLIHKYMINENRF